MHSKLLEKHGLKTYIAGADYDFRYTRLGDKVKEEVEEALACMSQKPDEVYSSQQVDGDQIAYCDGQAGDEYLYGRRFKYTDGLITDKTNIALMLKVADSTPVILYDPVNKIQAAVHSGWRGAVQKVVDVAIQKMVHDFDCKEENILAYIGPSIDQDHYPVEDHIYDAFDHFDSRDDFFEKKDGQWHLSIVKANQAILLEAGILPEHIEIESQSTYTSDDLNSIRRSRAENEDYGLNAIFSIMVE